MVTILISAAFKGAVLIRGEAPIRGGGRLFKYGHPKKWRLSEALRLLEETRYYHWRLEFF